MDGSPILAVPSKLLQRIYKTYESQAYDTSVPTCLVDPVHREPAGGPRGLHRISERGQSLPILQSKSERTREEEKYGKRADCPRRNQIKPE